VSRLPLRPRVPAARLLSRRAGAGAGVLLL